MIKEFLIQNADENLKRFHEKLIYTKLPIYGIRTEKLRKFACSLVKNGIVPKDIENTSHEEILLKGLVLSKQKWTDLEIIKAFEEFNSYIDNWATCDMITSSLTALKTENGRKYKRPCFAFKNAIK